MSAHPNPLETEAFEAAKSHYYRNAATIHLALRNVYDYIPRLQYLQSHPVFRYTVETPVVTSAYTVQGLNHNIVESYAPNTRWLLNDYKTLVIPKSAYAIESWPYDQTLVSGRAIGTILGWMALAFSTASSKVHIEIPLDACELCPLLYGCNLLGMTSLREQIEQVLVNIVRFRPLKVREIMAIWHYHHSTVNPQPGVLNMSLGFQTKDFMLMFGKNVRDMTSRQWRADTTGEFDEERAAYGTFMAAQPELCRLMYTPNLHTYITMLEPRPDRAWSKQRIAAWVVENQSEYGRAAVYPMPRIERQY
jgi:hypothetical protein